jgi:HTH-like domain
VVEAIRLVLAAMPFHGEGYRKVRARLAHRGLAVGGKRVLRLMRTHRLLAPLGRPKDSGATAPSTPAKDRPGSWFGGAIMESSLGLHRQPGSR